MELATDAADTVKDRGLTYEAQGNTKAALEDYERFLQMIAHAPSERRAAERLKSGGKPVRCGPGWGRKPGNAK